MASKLKMYECVPCKFAAKRMCELKAHCETKRHLAGGKKSFKCQSCDHEAVSGWNLNMHTVAAHSTKEERMAQKYYCEVCDSVFFTQLQKTRHMEGVIHILKAKKLEDQKKKDDSETDSDSDCSSSDSDSVSDSSDCSSSDSDSD